MNNSLNHISLISSLNQLENELQGLYYTVIQKSDKAYSKLVSKLTNSIVNTFDKQRIEAINQAIDYLSHLPADESISESHMQKLNEIFQSYLSIDFEDAVRENIYELGTQLYKNGINEVSKTSGIKLFFDVNDQNAADILSSHNLFYIGNYYDEHISENLNGILKDYYTGNKTIKDVREDFYNKYSRVTEKGQSYFEGLAEHTASRARELGKITGFEKAGIAYYEIRAIIDDRTSDICLSMNGRIFPVSDGANLRDEILSMSSPEEIKSVAPWRAAGEVSNLHTSDLPPGMEFPPYHFRCRTIAVAYPFEDFQTEFLIPPDEEI